MNYSGYRLRTLHLYNWGAFSGRHQADIDAGNTAIIGPTGSGKTTLIDALMTLLCANPRYNLASTGGHESDRDLVSYVRGASGPGHAGEDSDHLARHGRCVTGIAAQLVGGPDGCDTILVGGIFWFDGSSSSVADMHRRWCFAQGGGHSLDLWLEAHHSGGAKALGRLEKGTDGLQIFSSKSAYLARLQRCFEVGQNAFTLLNRAAGLKQLNSIDEIFRELVLDDHSAFESALKVAGGFDELAAIHAELDLANRQYVALLPLRDLAQREAQLGQGLIGLRRLHAALPYWFATQGATLWGARCQSLQGTLAALQSGIDEADAALQRARIQESQLLELYIQAGGGDIQTLQTAAGAQRIALAQRQKNLDDYQQLARNLGLTGPENVSQESLEQCQVAARSALQALETEQRALHSSLETAVAREHNAQERLKSAQTELQAVRQRPDTNLPSEAVRFRGTLAEHLGLSTTDLPFVAEMVEVQKKQHAWRGAIERAIGGHRLRIFVPSSAIHTALDWVNQRHNHWHVRLLEVQQPAHEPRFLRDGFACKLNFKPHACEGSLRELLADLDLHCVDSPEALRATPHAMTPQGLMSGKARHFDKQDQRRIDQDWMTGFDNRDRVAHLEQEIAALQGLWESLDSAKREAQALLNAARDQRTLWERLLALRYADLDTADLRVQLQELQRKLDALLDPRSDAGHAKALWEQAKNRNNVSDGELVKRKEARAAADNECRRAERQYALCQTRLADQPEMELADTAMAALLAHPLDCESIGPQEQAASTRLSQQMAAQSSLMAEIQKDIIRQMARAQKEDRGALNELLQEVEALPHFLERLRILEEEALPEKRQRFQEYLNNASDQGVSTLLSGIEAQVSEITERMDQLNQTLKRVDFHDGQYLQLDPQAVVHPSLQTLNKALALLRSERLRDDGGHGHYSALQALVEMLREHATNRRTKAAQALLDARYRLQFAVQVIDRNTGQILERRTGSQGGSGGEKEIIASYVLTASLSYALCPPGRSQPLFSGIVLDEAFSKSSQTVAARIIQALREFGLHALFVTPNKELRLLRNHTRSAVLVHRQGRQATLASISWQELDARARQRQDRR